MCSILALIRGSQKTHMCSILISLNSAETFTLISTVSPLLTSPACARPPSPSPWPTEYHQNLQQRLPAGAPSLPEGALPSKLSRIIFFCLILLLDAASAFSPAFYILNILTQKNKEVAKPPRMPWASHDHLKLTFFINVLSLFFIKAGARGEFQFDALHCIRIQYQDTN